MISKTKPTKHSGASISFLAQRAKAILKHRYQLRPGQKVLVVYDAPKERIGKAFVKGAREIGAKVDSFRLRKNRFSPKTRESLANKVRIGNYHIFVNIVEGRGEELNERGELMTNQMAAQKESGGAMLHGPNFQESMLELDVDYQQMSETAKRGRDALKDVDEVEIKTDLGTSLRFSILNRDIWDEAIPKKHDWTNFPCGGVFVAPIEDSAEGILIANNSIGGSFIDLLPQPLRFEIKNGRIVKLNWINNSSRNSSFLEDIRRTLFQDEGANVLCEFGIGVAPYPVCGILLQDEKVAGTADIAFGRNDFFGGINASISHVDFSILSPEITLNYATNKAPVLLMREGKLLI